MTLSALAAAAAAITLVAVPAPVVVPGSTDVCTWRLAAIRLYQELATEPGEQASAWRELLADSGVGKPDFLPEQCRAPRTPRPPAEGPGGPGAGDAGDSPSGGAGTASAGAESSAAELHGWGQPNRVEAFDSAATLTQNWSVYDGPGHAGNGRRTPDAAAVADGVLTITGDSQGSTAGMAWGAAQQYGRWEGRVRAPVADPSYNALLLLWPAAENFPIGGEIDFMEMMDPSRQQTDIFVHYGADNSQVNGNVKVDATEWHNWAVEWTPLGITAYVDGKEWYRTTDISILPPGPMHLCIQLDWFPEGDTAKESSMQVDWVKQYPLNGTGEAGGGSSSLTGSLTAGVSADGAASAEVGVSAGGGSTDGDEQHSTSRDAGRSAPAAADGGSADDSSSPSDESDSSDS